MCSRVWSRQNALRHTEKQVAEFLGWVKGKGNIPNEACRVAFATLESQSQKTPAPVA